MLRRAGKKISPEILSNCKSPHKKINRDGSSSLNLQRPSLSLESIKNSTCCNLRASIFIAGLLNSFERNENEKQDEKDNERND